MVVLDQYDDYELAFIIRYTLKSYMKSTQMAIKDEVTKRGLTDQKQKILINERLKEKIPADHNTICPRCKSSKIIGTREMHYSQWSKNPIYYYNLFTCGVCGNKWKDNKIYR